LIVTRSPGDTVGVEVLVIIIVVISLPTRVSYNLANKTPHIHNNHSKEKDLRPAHKVQLNQKILRWPVP
jgi:hypothetical protein